MHCLERIEEFREISEKSKKIKITFMKGESWRTIGYLLMMARLKEIVFDKGFAEDERLSEIFVNNSWGDSDRSVNITLTDKFREDSFFGQVLYSLERVEASSK